MSPLAKTKRRTIVARKTTKTSQQGVQITRGAGFNDGLGAVTPLRYSIPNGTPYVDFNSTGAINNTVTSFSLLTPLLGAGGVLPSFPSIATPIFTGGSLDVYAKVHIKSIMLSVSMTGAEGTLLAAADLYNRMRFILYTTGVVYSITPIIPLETQVERWPNMVDTSEVLADLVFDLPTVSFEPSTRYNAPAVRTYRANIPVNKTFDCYTQTDTGTTLWDTKNGNLLYSCVSDSSVFPHPTIACNARVFYEIPRR